MATKDLGMVTAYAYAVSKGFIGTEDDFATGLLNSAEYASNAEASADRAEQSAEEAAEHASQITEIYVSGTSLIINTHVTDGNEVSY